MGGGGGGLMTQGTIQYFHHDEWAYCSLEKHTDECLAFTLCFRSYCPTCCWQHSQYFVCSLRGRHDTGMGISQWTIYSKIIGTYSELKIERFSARKPKLLISLQFFKLLGICQMLTLLICEKMSPYFFSPRRGDKASNTCMKVHLPPVLGMVLSTHTQFLIFTDQNPKLFGNRFSVCPYIPACLKKKKNRDSETHKRTYYVWYNIDFLSPTRHTEYSILSLGVWSGGRW